jgi:hypothetical protein
MLFFCPKLQGGFQEFIFSNLSGRISPLLLLPGGLQFYKKPDITRRSQDNQDSPLILSASREGLVASPDKLLDHLIVNH